MANSTGVLLLGRVESYYLLSTHIVCMALDTIFRALVERKSKSASR
jgi:hypothetical protein